MASLSGISSGSGTQLTSSGSEGDLRSATAVAAPPDQRKQKRMLSNRESARRSRMRKQKHLDDLNAQADQLRKENMKIAASLGETLKHFMNVEAENSVLRTRMAELETRLRSLHDILQLRSFIGANGGNGGAFSAAAAINGCFSPFEEEEAQVMDSFMRPWNVMVPMVNQPLMDMF